MKECSGVDHTDAYRQLRLSIRLSPPFDPVQFPCGRSIRLGVLTTNRETKGMSQSAIRANVPMVSDVISNLFPLFIFDFEVE